MMTGRTAPNDNHVILFHSSPQGRLCNHPKVGRSAEVRPIRAWEKPTALRGRDPTETGTSTGTLSDYTDDATSRAKPSFGRYRDDAGGSSLTLDCREPSSRLDGVANINQQPRNTKRTVRR